MKRDTKRMAIRIVWLAAVFVGVFILGYGVFLMRSEMVRLTENYRYYFSAEGVILDWSPADDHVQASALADAYRRGVRMPRVGPNVDGYCVYDRIITGHVANSWEGETRPKYISPDPARTPGYFIINRHTHETLNGLTKEKWVTLLSGFGVVSEPRLHKPSRLDRLPWRDRSADK